ncbi:hypothetical protein BBJ28_00012291 [Nothophytophthora sp. Chile5]|nr:hypothetical protein BBJ28_00012291 [Nothophytophthora sp. Chile5]
MWVSSFARGSEAAAAAALDDADEKTVRAHVWGSERTPALSSSWAPSAQTADDALTLVATADMTVLRQLRVVNGSYVRLSFQARSHVGRLLLVPNADVCSTADEDQEETKEDEAIGDVTLSPLLAFNLGIPLHAVKASHLSIRAISLQELGLAGLASSPSAPFRRKRQEQPAPATYAMIAPLLVSSLSCRQHALMQQRNGLLDAIRAFFASPKVLQVGDVFAVALHETTQSHAPVENERSNAAYVPYKRVEVPIACLLPTRDGIALESEANIAVSTIELMPPTLELDTSLVFFRVEKLDGEAKDALALTVSDATELMQGSSSSASSPDEGTIKRFLATCSCRGVSGAAAQLDSALPSTAQHKLYEVLYPAQLCEIPVSVLLSGARGVGKRTLVHQVAKHLGVLVVEVPFTELTGQSELHLLENVREQVSKAQALSPCLLYISRFFPVEKDNEEAELRIGAVLSECIRSLSQHQHNIPLIACVEDVNEVPKFIRQCFLYEMQLEAPDQTKRLDFLQHISASIELNEAVDLKEIAQLTAGRTYGELSALLADAGALAVERILGGEDLASEGVPPLEDLVFTDSEELTPPCSVMASDLEEAAHNQQAQASSANIGNASIPNVKWTDVGGLEDVKDEILDVVQLPIKHPELFASGVRQRSGILLYGPPGTGKTLLAKAIATECNLNFLSVKGPELLNMYIGESEKNVRQVFAKARSCRPCILFFDELDSLAPMRGRGSDSGGVMDRVVSQLLTEIDGLSGGGNDQVFVIGATNRPDLLETGLLRPGRFDRLLYLGICNEKSAQLKVLKAQTRKFALGDEADLEAVVEQCPTNFTGADFYALSSGALAAALKDRVEALDRQIEDLRRQPSLTRSKRGRPTRRRHIVLAQTSTCTAALNHSPLQSESSAEMLNFLPSAAVSLTVCALAFSPAAATSHSALWRSQFRSKINVMPTPTASCFVCFYEQTNFSGPKFCVGKRSETCTRANPIMAPSTIESIKFGSGCDLVVNVRVTDTPYAEHVDVISADVADTGYNLTAYKHVVQELYVEEAGRACFLGTPESADSYGRCYTEDVSAVEGQYRDVFSELLMFKTTTTDFDVIAYEKDDFNGAAKSPVQRSSTDQDTTALSQRFTGYSHTLDTDSYNSATGMKKTMQGKVRSIAFVAPDAGESTPGSVAPYAA